MVNQPGTFNIIIYVCLYKIFVLFSIYFFPVNVIPSPTHIPMNCQNWSFFVYPQVTACRSILNFLPFY